MNKFICAFLILSTVSNAQETAQYSIKQLRQGLVLIPSTATDSYGISIGLLGSEVWCGMPYFKKSHGTNIQSLGQGALGMFISLDTYKYLGKSIKNPINEDSLRTLNA
tara:strand:+ start:390 stop:713 length:324 start_codon:yes stop_codon:yes gene_type:complete